MVMRSNFEVIYTWMKQMYMNPLFVVVYTKLIDIQKNGHYQRVMGGLGYIDNDVVSESQYPS